MSTIKDGKKSTKQQGKAVILYADGNIQLADFVDELEFFYEKIGCRCIDIVYADDDGLLLVLDDEGLLKEKPQLNRLASMIYGYPLAGTIVVVKNFIDEENEQSWTGLDVNDLDEFFFKYIM